MDDKNIIDIWKHSVDNLILNIDHATLISELKAKVNKLDRSIRIRNILEIAAALVLIPIFSYWAFQEPSLVFKAGCAITVLWGLYVIYRLISTRNNKPANLEDLPLKMQLVKQKEYLLKEVKLLDQVLYWYIIPFYIGQILLIGGLFFENDFSIPDSFPREGMVDQIIYFVLRFLPYYFFTMFIAFVTAFSYFVVKLNKDAAKNDLLPAIYEIEKIEEQL